LKKPFDKAWYMKNNVPVERIIYLVESYIASIQNPTKEVDGKGFYYKLGKKIKNQYYMITEDELKNSGAIGLIDQADCKPENKLFDSKKELLDSL